MLNFFKDFNQINNNDSVTPAAAADPESDQITADNSFTADDMKAYFETMKESLVTEITEQIKSNLSKKEGVENNASSTDLSSGQSDSSKPAVDR